MSPVGYPGMGYCGWCIPSCVLLGQILGARSGLIKCTVGIRITHQWIFRPPIFADCDQRKPKLQITALYFISHKHND